MQFFDTPQRIAYVRFAKIEEKYVINIIDYCGAMWYNLYIDKR